MFKFEPGRQTRRAFILHRAVPMTTVLRDFGTELFMFSPRHVLRETGEVEGYVIEDGRMVPRSGTVPLVNGDWYIGTSRRVPNNAMSKSEFATWVRHRRIDVYPSAALTQKLRDKYSTYKMLSEIDPRLQPYTEPFESDREQLERFLAAWPTVFLKPNKGNRGNGIVVVGRSMHGFDVARHRGGERDAWRCASIDELLATICAVADRRPYIVQEGVEYERFEGSSYMIRIVMADDGDQWHWLYKAHIAASDSAVANISQGGRNVRLEDVLAHLYGEAEVQPLLERLRRICFATTTQLDGRYPGIMELAYDILIDGEHNPRIVEVNAKPGLTLPSLRSSGTFRNIFTLSRRDERRYGRIVVPYATHLAGFLQKRLEARLDEIGTAQPFAGAPAPGDARPLVLSAGGASGPLSVRSLRSA